MIGATATIEQLALLVHLHVVRVQHKAAECRSFVQRAEHQEDVRCSASDQYKLVLDIHASVLFEGSSRRVVWTRNLAAPA